MLESLSATCDAPGCDRDLDDAAFRLAYRTEAGERRVYECACGSVTVTVSK
ncbi:MAG: hypothetical protein ABEJ06_05505 [Haloarculaceae archaeon]